MTIFGGHISFQVPDIDSLQSGGSGQLLVTDQSMATRKMSGQTSSYLTKWPANTPHMITTPAQLAKGGKKHDWHTIVDGLSKLRRSPIDGVIRKPLVVTRIQRPLWDGARTNSFQSCFHSAIRWSFILMWTAPSSFEVHPPPLSWLAKGGNV